MHQNTHSYSAFDFNSIYSIEISISSFLSIDDWTIKDSTHFLLALQVWPNRSTQKTIKNVWKQCAYFWLTSIFKLVFPYSNCFCSLQRSRNLQFLSSVHLSVCTKNFLSSRKSVNKPKQQQLLWIGAQHELQLHRGRKTWFPILRFLISIFFCKWSSWSNWFGALRWKLSNPILGQRDSGFKKLQSTSS